MTQDQFILFALLGLVFVFLVWGRWRYDLVAFIALLAAVLTGLVPTEQAFAGFGHPATVIIALVLVVSRGLANSGAIELLARYLVDRGRSLGMHIGIMGGLAAALSAVMNNVAALALLMPLELQAADKAGRSPALSLMPVSFASILGGMITVIGTPPNIVIAEYRAEVLGEPFRMFDFAPVGLACALAGILFVTLLGWRLLPLRGQAAGASRTAQFKLSEYVAEVSVPKQSKIIGQRVAELDAAAANADVEIIGLVRRGQRMPGFGRRVEIRAGDVLVVQARPERIEELLGALQLEYVSAGSSALEAEDLELMEAVVPETSSLAGRTARSLRLLYRYGVALVGIAREGQRFRERVRETELRAGDVLLLLGNGERLADAIARLHCLPLRHRGQRVIQREKVWLAVGTFAAAIALAAAGVVYLPVALGIVVAVMTLTGIVPLREIYDAVEWPVIVLLGCMIPIGGALQSTGGTELIAGGLVQLAGGFSPVVVMVLLMVATMTLSDVMNNTATAVIAAPIAVQIARLLDVNADPFLMGVAVASSCAFLTPIGHKNNTLILGPGGYHFGDYWRMGLPLELLVLLVGVPALVVFWPL